ncbi:MAG: hypothetical protein HY819_04020 [Acidobacteria bacterium]|nr:hypothetical protein [Acidobacteriota bacterium]
MKKIFFRTFFLALFVLAFSTMPSYAQKPLKGGWTFTIQSPMGALPIPFAFKAGGKGTATVPTGALQVAYREKAANISVSLEAPGLAPDGTDLTFVIRGTKTDTTVTATAIVITSAADPSTPGGFAITTLPVAGKRN